MVQASDIAKHMEVVGSDGLHVGTVDEVEGQSIKLTKTDSTDHHHHRISLASVARVDGKVHLNTTASGALAAAPIADRTVAAVPAKQVNWLAWLLLLAGVLAALWFIRNRMAERQAPVVTSTTEAPVVAPLAVEKVALPNGTSVDLEPNGLNYTLQRYLASSEATPRTFTFDKLNFDTASAAIRPEDTANIDALAQILAAYPKAAGTVVGYTDAKGDSGANAQLGKQRADAVVAALTAKGIAANRLMASTGGETNPTDTNATSGGRFDNRRTELTITAK